MTSPDLRISTYKKASATIQTLYGSVESGEVMREVFLSHELPEEKYVSYGNIVGDVILGFYPKGQLPRMLEENLQIPNEIALEIAHQLSNFLAPVPDTPTSPQQTLVQDKRLELRPEDTPQQSADTRPQGAPAETPAKPLTREELMNSLSPQRTMAGDIETVRWQSEVEDAEEGDRG